jgi:hypothetical protein
LIDLLLLLSNPTGKVADNHIIKYIKTELFRISIFILFQFFATNIILRIAWLFPKRQQFF